MNLRKEKACTKLNPNILKYYYKGVCTERILPLEYDLKYESTGGIKKQFREVILNSLISKYYFSDFTDFLIQIKNAC